MFDGEHKMAELPVPPETVAVGVYPGKELPAAFFTVTVIVDFETPSAVVGPEAATVDCPAFGNWKLVIVDIFVVLKARGR